MLNVWPFLLLLKSQGSWTRNGSTGIDWRWVFVWWIATSGLISLIFFFFLPHMLCTVVWFNNEPIDFTVTEGVGLKEERPGEYWPFLLTGATLLCLHKNNVTPFPFFLSGLLKRRLNDLNNSSVWCSCLNLLGTFCTDSGVVSAGAQQMLIFPAAPLIMAGIVVIELLSHCRGCAEPDSPTASCFWWRALGRGGVTDDRKDRKTRAAHEEAPSMLLWNIHDFYCSLRKEKQPKHTWRTLFLSLFLNLRSDWLLPPAETWAEMSAATSLPSSPPVHEEVPVHKSLPLVRLMKRWRGCNGC